MQLKNIWNNVIFEDSSKTISETLSVAIKGGISLRQLRLRSEYIDNVDFSYADLSNADLYNCDFANLNFTGAKLIYCNLSFCNFRDSKLNIANLRNSNLSYASLVGVNLAGAILSGTNLYMANLCDTFLQNTILPTPTMVLLANWGCISNELTTDLINFDRANHPNPELFDRWAKGGGCPYKGSCVDRATNFYERRDAYNPNKPLLSAYELMIRLLKEKCIYRE